jgi:hypothetical protein
MPARLPAVSLAAAVALLLAAPAADACRCAQRSLDDYFAEAEIVLVGEVTRVEERAIDGVEVHVVEVKPRFRQGRPFKGSADGVTLATPVGSARCGVAVEVGETYLIFAARTAPDDTLAWFDSCGGSRLYAGGPRAGETAPFVGLPTNRIVPRLFELAGDGEEVPKGIDLGSVVVPGSRTEAPPPLSRPAAGEPGRDDARATVSALAYLDGDWNGRVYDRPGGRVSVLSALPGARDRREHPVDVVAASEASGGLWLRVEIYLGNPCEDLDTLVAHSGWVPAYSAAGALVAGTYPGGC